MENYIVKIVISKLQNENDDSIEFIRCFDYTEEKIKSMKEVIKKINYDFFFKRNYYYEYDYCINLKYTDLNNFKIDDMYFWKNNYCTMPNSNYGNEEQIATFNRRRDRLKNCLESKNSENILLIYMDQLILDTSINEKIEDIIKKYNLPYSLFYIIPIYSEISEDENNEKLTKINNITFYTVYFKSLEFQKINNPNDDCNLFYVDQYNKIKENLSKSYNFDIINL